MLKAPRSRLDSVTDDISRAESKAGESTIESDKLVNLLKIKEDNIRQLMKQLKNSDHNFEPKSYDDPIESTYLGSPFIAPHNPTPLTYQKLE